MRLGYDRPLHLLKFDHRHSFVTGIFHFRAPLTAQQKRAVSDCKAVIYKGFRQALGHAEPVGGGGILVDEEYDAPVLREASSNGYVTALSVEASESAEFDFAYGPAFARHIHALAPTFAKASVRYNVGGDPSVNARQAARLRQLSEYCRNAGQRLMVELLVPPTVEQSEHVAAVGGTYDLLLRPALMVEAIRALQDNGVEPDVWIVEGLDRRRDCEDIVAIAQRGGRSQVGCMVLGHNSEGERVPRWLETAASVRGFIGCAVGPTTFRRAVAAHAAKQLTRREAATIIARRYRESAIMFERARCGRVTAGESDDVVPGAGQLLVR